MAAVPFRCSAPANTRLITRQRGAGWGDFDHRHFVLLSVATLEVELEVCAASGAAERNEQIDVARDSISLVSVNTPMEKQVIPIQGAI